jgi:triacylglycerol lipase
MRRTRTIAARDHAEADVSLWTEALFPAELLLLSASPVYYGFGIPRGDGSAVILIPGFLCGDGYLMPMRWWLDRIGYSACYSGIGVNADCPNLLIQQRLTKTIEAALQDTGRPIHLIGHSLGGIIARSIAAQRPKEIASVITLGSPFRGMTAHRSILRAAEQVRLRIVQEHGDGVLPDCYTGRCTCDFLKSVRRCLPASVLETAIYTPDDGIVDWRCCTTNDQTADFSVHGTHVGLAFNPSVYQIIATRLAEADSRVQ